MPSVYQQITKGGLKNVASNIKDLASRLSLTGGVPKSDFSLSGTISKNYLDKYKKPSGGFDPKKLQVIQKKKGELVDYVKKGKDEPQTYLSGLTEQESKEGEERMSLLNLQKEKEDFVRKDLMIGTLGTFIAFDAQRLPYHELQKQYPDEVKKAEGLFKINQGKLISKAKIDMLRKITGLSYAPSFLLEKLPPQFLAKAKQQYEEKTKGQLPEGVAMEQLVLQTVATEKFLETERVENMDIFDKAIYKTKTNPFTEGVVDIITLGANEFGMSDFEKRLKFERLSQEDFASKALRFTGGLIGAFLPYGLIAKGVKIGVAGLAANKAIQSSGKLYKGIKYIDGLAKTNKLWTRVLGEALVFNPLEEVADMVIRKGVLRQDYTFEDFMRSIVYNVGIGSVLQLGGAARLRLKDKKVQKQIDDVFKAYEEDGDYTRIVRMPLGESTFGKVFGETRLAYLKGLEDSNARPGIEKAAPLSEVLRSENNKFESRVYERLQHEIPEEIREAVNYKPQNLKDNINNATKLFEKDKNRAYRIAMGAEDAPTGQTSTAVNIVFAEKALQEGNNKLYSQLVKNRSLEQTRRGQEIVAEKSSVTDNSTARYVKELLEARMEKLGTDYTSVIEKIKKVSSKQKVIKRIDLEVEKASKKIARNKLLDISEAQKIIDNLIC